MRAGKFIFILAAWIMIPFIGFCQQCDSIRWSDHHLKWKYFKGRPDAKSNMAALSESHIYYEISTMRQFAKLMISCSFSTCHSWVKSVADHLLLEHEQTHFDIAEYHKRLMVKEVLGQRFTYSDVLIRVQSIGALINKSRREMDEIYDLETYHSINKEKQREWTKKVQKLLKKLDEYDKYSYIITLR